MTRTWLRFVAIGGIAALLLTGCGGGGGSTGVVPANGGSGTQGGSSSPNMSSLSTAPLAVGESRQFTPSESGYGGSFTVSSSAPGVVAANPGSGAGPFTLTGMAPGNATITVSDGNGHSSAVPLSVGAISFGSLSTAPLAVGATRQFTPTEPGTSSFTVSSSAPGVISAAPASGAGPFTLTGVSAGTATITVADARGNHESVLLTASGSGGSSPAPTATPTSAPTATPTARPTATPTSVPTATPTPAAIGFSPSTIGVSLYQVQKVSVANHAGGTSYTISNHNPNIATIAKNSDGTYSVVGNHAGYDEIWFTDNLGHTALLPVTVSATPAPKINLTVVGDTNGYAGMVAIGANALVIAASESGYTGTFSASITSGNNAAVVAVTPLDTFAVATAAAGSGIVTIRDTQGNSSSLGFTAQ